MTRYYVPSDPTWTGGPLIREDPPVLTEIVRRRLSLNRTDLRRDVHLLSSWYRRVLAGSSLDFVRMNDSDVRPLPEADALASLVLDS